MAGVNIGSSTVIVSLAGGSNVVPLGPNSCEAYGINVVKKADVPNGSPEAYQAILDGLKAMNMQVMSEDQSVYQNIRFVQGALLECDRELGKYFDYLRTYPRGNVGREYINGEGNR